MARACPFCDRRADSAEHVYPGWMTRRYARGAGPRAFFTMDLGWSFGVRRAKTLNQTVKVCATCNNGWMSHLESEARPWLERLADGTPTRLLLPAQRSLAHWLLKSAVVHELLLDTGAVSTSGQRAELAAGTIPPGWTAHLGVADRTPGADFIHHAGPIVTWRADDGALRGRCQLHTTRFGHLAAQVVIHSLVEEDPPVFGSLLGGEGYAVSIWPTDAVVDWPPPLVLTAEGFDAVCDLRES